MKNKLSLLSDVFALLVGVLFIVLFCKGIGAFEVFSVMLGIAFILISSLALIAIFTKASEEFVDGSKSGWLTVPSVGGLLLGIVLVAVPSFFAGFLSFVFAALLIIGALYKFWGLFAVRRAMIVYPVWFYIVPSLIFVCGIVLFAIGIDVVQTVLSLVIGVSFVAYALNSIVERLTRRRFAAKVKTWTSRRSATKTDARPSETNRATAG